jgi:hypothetical protein
MRAMVVLALFAAALSVAPPPQRATAIAVARARIVRGTRVSLGTAVVRNGRRQRGLVEFE